MTKLLDLLEAYLRWRQLPEVGPGARPQRARCASLSPGCALLGVGRAAPHAG